MTRAQLLDYVRHLKTMIGTLQTEIRKQGIPTAGPQEITAHDAAWRDHFIKPIGNFMHAKGIREIRLELQNGKCRYWLEPTQED